MAKLFANSGDPDQMQQNVASDLGLHCLPITLLGVSRLQWVKYLPLLVSVLYEQLQVIRCLYDSKDPDQIVHP